MWQRHYLALLLLFTTPMNTSWGSHWSMAHKDMIESIKSIDEEMEIFATPSMMTSFLGIGVWTRKVAAFNLLRACTIRHPSVALHKQKAGELCGEVDSLTCPAAKRSANNLSIASTFLRGSGHYFMTQYFEPGSRSILWRSPLSFDNLHCNAPDNTSLNSIKTS